MGHHRSMKLNEQAVLRFMADKDYRPMDQSEMARAMEIHSNDRAALRNILHKLASAGKIIQGKKSRYETARTAATKTPRTLVGTIRFAPKGFAWVYADIDAPENKDWDFAQFDRFRAEQRDCGTALDGDRVMVQVLAPPKFQGGRGRLTESELEEVAPKVRVEQVISRRSGKVIGIFLGGCR
jgi:hypothetical protein